MPWYARPGEAHGSAHPAQLPWAIEPFLRALPRFAPVRRGSLFLEVGTGSGRVTRPLREALAAEGACLIGVDLSHAKLGRLAAQTRENPINLVQADACGLPFPTAHLDAIITIRVLHLIAQPELALQEFRRLLKPDGAYLQLEEITDDGSVRLQMRTRWQELLRKSSLPQRHGGRSDASIDAILQGIGARGTALQLAQAHHHTTAGREIERIALRVQDGAWRVPAELLPGLLAELRAWAEAEYRSLERELSYDEIAVLHVWRF
jgi:SAM-dependent methyltransferase